MLQLQYDLGNSPINIYLDRPNLVLESLVDINVRFFIIGQYKDEGLKNFRKVEYITPDIKPHIVLSQTKLQNFQIMMKFAEDYNVPFVHFETRGLPSGNGINKLAQNELKNVRANVNVFSDISLVREWEFDEEECVVIPYGFKCSFEKNEKLHHISNELPVLEMSKGVCPIVQKTNTTKQFIQNAYNGFLYEQESDIGIIVNRLSEMDECDVRKIGENARSTIVNKFPFGPFADSWKKLLRSML